VGAAAELLTRVRADPSALDDPETAEIGRRVRIIMMQEPDGVDVGQTLQQMGVDSLMTVKFRRWWKLSFSVGMTTLEMMGGGTLRDLGAVLASKIKDMLKDE